MMYLVKMSDRKIDKYIELTVEETNVFDAVSKAALLVENPEDTELIECIPPVGGGLNDG